MLAHVRLGYLDRIEAGTTQQERVVVLACKKRIVRLR
jgi:hypothetical protein